MRLGASGEAATSGWLQQERGAASLVLFHVAFAILFSCAFRQIQTCTNVTATKFVTPGGDKLMCFFLLPRKAVADRKRGCGVEQRISTAEAVADRKRGCGVEQRFCYAAFDTDTIIAQHIYRAFGRLRHVT
jgi:hypothetical protein